jgi:hypothetical protein
MKTSIRHKYQWVLHDDFKSIRHAMSNELQATEEERKREDTTDEFAAFRGLSRKETVGEYTSGMDMGHVFWRDHYKGDAADDLAKIVAAVPDWGRRIACSVGYVNSKTDDFVVAFVEPEPFVEVGEGKAITADTIRELVDKTYAMLPIAEHPELLVTECNFTA